MLRGDMGWWVCKGLLLCGDELGVTREKRVDFLRLCCEK